MNQRLSWQTAIRARLEGGIADGDMPAGAIPIVIAEYVMTVLNGMAVQALARADQAALTTVAELALVALSVNEPVPARSKKRGRAPARAPGKQVKLEALPGQLMMDL